MMLHVQPSVWLQFFQSLSPNNLHAKQNTTLHFWRGSKETLLLAYLQLFPLNRVSGILCCVVFLRQRHLHQFNAPCVHILSILISISSQHIGSHIGCGICSLPSPQQQVRLLWRAVYMADSLYPALAVNWGSSCCWCSLHGCGPDEDSAALKSINLFSSVNLGHAVLSVIVLLVSDLLLPCGPNAVVMFE